ncbi:Hypothetical predicted protein [Olea europaea subsp. europaea]|uniref:Uncharacterized protein n=1 Tax=Olea europaea subsp. europaea TaxID=158383 RepID=A0A8S0RV38_OLEEU|nr:Hypothetical predicted protein [Olea europaea subsp. europaea]
MRRDFTTEVVALREEIGVLRRDFTIEVVALRDEIGVLRRDMGDLHTEAGRKGVEVEPEVSEEAEMARVEVPEEAEIEGMEGGTGVPKGETRGAGRGNRGGS